MVQKIENRITLYTHPASPYVKRVEIALVEAGVDFDRHIIDLFVPRPEWYLREVNPVGKIPAISYGPRAPSNCIMPPPNSFHLCESLVILTFLADLYPQLLPATPIDRARAQFFIAKVEEKVMATWYGVVAIGDIEMEALVNGMRDVQDLLPDPKEGDSEETGYAAGRWSIADAAFMPLLYFVELYMRNDLCVHPVGKGRDAWVEMFEGERFGRLQAYFKRVKARKSWGLMTDEKWMLEFLPQFMAFYGIKRREA
ncbi:hypothetical protein PENSPDRAFT_634496 [Peniophora sp. CONT]|nr:hypothetical protein PENSPDRAFT_634496 [Peniophora sp. CONT]